MNTNKINQSNISEIFGEPTYIYRREQAIEDGFLIDVSSMAKEAGFTIPVAVTHSVWTQYIEWTDEDTKRQAAQDTNGRMWDVIWMLHVAIKKLSNNNSSLLYTVYVVPRGGRSRKAKEIQLKSIIAGGDNGEPVITIMMPNED